MVLIDHSPTTISTSPQVVHMSLFAIQGSCIVLPCFLYVPGKINKILTMDQRKINIPLQSSGNQGVQCNVQLQTFESPIQAHLIHGPNLPMGTGDKHLTNIRTVKIPLHQVFVAPELDAIEQVGQRPRPGRILLQKKQLQRMKTNGLVTSIPHRFPADACAIAFLPLLDNEYSLLKKRDNMLRDRTRRIQLLKGLDAEHHPLRHHFGTYMSFHTSIPFCVRLGSFRWIP